MYIPKYVITYVRHTESLYQGVVLSFKLSVSAGSQKRTIRVECCCSYFVVIGSRPLRVRKIVSWPKNFYPPDVRVHAAAPMLGYKRLPRFRVRHSKPRFLGSRSVGGVG